MKLWVLLVVLLLLIFFRLRLRFFYFINYYFSFKIKTSSSSSSLLLFIQMLVGISAYLWVTLFSAHDVAYSREYPSTEWTRDRGFSGSHHLVQVQELKFRPLVEGFIYLDSRSGVKVHKNGKVLGTQTCQALGPASTHYAPYTNYMKEPYKWLP